MVDAIHNCCINIIAARGRDNHFLGAAGQMSTGFLFTGEKAGALQHDIDIQLFPGKLGGIAFRQHLDAVTIDDHVVAFDRHFSIKPTMGGVVLRQVGIDTGITEIVDGNDFDRMLFASLIVGSKHISADPAVSVNGNASRHVDPR